MKLRTFKELLEMSQDKLDEILIPIKVRQMNAKVELELTKVDTVLIEKEKAVQEYLATKEIDFNKIINMFDEISLLERKKKQYEDIQSQLFPVAE